MKKYCRYILRNPRLVVLTCVLATIIFSSGAIKLGFTNDYQAFFSDTNPQLIEFENLKKKYGGNDNVLIMLVPESGNVFEENTVQAILELTRASWMLPYVRRVDSLSNYQYSYSEGDDIFLEDMIPDPQSADLGVIKQRALSEPLLLNRLISPNADATGINIRIKLPGMDPLSESPAVVKAVRSMIDDARQRYPGISFHLTGVVMLDNAMAEATTTDLSTLVPITFIVVAIGSAIFLRSIYLTITTVALVTMAICISMGIAGWMGIVLTPPSASVPPIIMTLAVAGCLHVLVTVQQKMTDGYTQNESVEQSLHINFQPVCLTAITTAMGFLTLNFSEAPPFRDLGNMTAIGVISALVLSLSFLPAMVSMRALHVTRHNDSLAQAMHRLAKWVCAWRRALLFTGITTIVLMSMLIPINQLSDNFVEYFDKSVTFRKDTDEVNDRLTGMYFVDYSLDTGVTDGATEPAYLEKLQQFEVWLEEQPEVVHVDSITEIIKRLHFNLHGNQEGYYTLPDDKQKIAQYLLLYEMSLPSGLDLSNQINVDKSATRVSISLTTISTTGMLAFEERVSQWMQKNIPELVSPGASPSVIFSHISVRNITSMLVAAVVALILISFALMLPFKSVRHGLLGLVSNLAPAAIAFGIWAVLIGKVSLGVSVVISMTLGIVVDDTIHLITKYLRARRDLGFSAEKSIIYSFQTVGVALFGTTIILIAGFSVMAFSSFQVNSHMGVLSAITIGIALIIDLLFIPPLLLVADRNVLKEPVQKP